MKTLIGNVCESGMEWTVPLYTRERVNAAAREMLAYDPDDEPFVNERYYRYLEALAVINNWRSSHNYPLNTFQIALRRYAREVCKAPLVAQRIKRLKSIDLKLRLQPKMKLTQMQDIGGCRAVVTNVNEVRKVAMKFSSGKLKHPIATVDDYVTKPRDSGYRGMHIVYQHQSETEKRVYNDLKVEIQLRSQFQHAWATAVETVGAFTRQALKSSRGDAEWLRFFAVMGTEIAFLERTAPVPNTPTRVSAVRDEIGGLATQLDVEKKLTAYREALRVLGSERLRGRHIYLLVLDPTNDELSITGFKANERAFASEQYLEAEKAVKENPKTDAVLVSVSSVTALKRAYPNYFADTRVFLQLMNQAISQSPTQISVSDALKAARTS